MAAATGAYPFQPLLSATAILALLWPMAAEADEAHADMHQALKAALPRYDPAIREKALTEQAKRSAERTPGAITAVNPPLPVPEKSSSDRSATVPPPGGPVVANDKPIELPKFEVRATYPRFKPMPRLSAENPIKDIPGEPFESRAGRDARLLRMYSSKLERILDKIPLIGGGLLGKVREADARAQKAKQMNAVADAIEWDEILGSDPAEVKKLRDEYEKLYYSGPTSLGH